MIRNTSAFLLLVTSICLQVPAQQLIQTPVLPQNPIPTALPLQHQVGGYQGQMPAPALPPQGSGISKGPTMAEQIVTPVAPIVVQPAPIIVPPGAVYVAPEYPTPGVGWVWSYHTQFGWGWHHPEHGWHRGWRN